MRWNRALREAGVLGINARNARFIARYNPRRLFPLVDDKLRCKELCREHGIPTPELYGVVEAHGDLRRLGDFLAGHEEFVIKPARGAMGNGVLVIAGREGEFYRKASGVLLDERAVRHYVSGILSGLYSLSGTADRAMIEYRIKRHPLFEPISVGGVPDLRVIVFKGVPVLAMVRLPTRKSDGRANLHQGAIAAGIDIATGTTTHAVQSSRLVEDHPDTGARVIGIRIPHWEEILRIAALTHDMTGLGYIGVDVVLDAELGPMLLEANARPGLAIQIANFQGLLHPLEQIERVDTRRLSVEERIELARRLRSPAPAPVEPAPAREAVTG
ncbi:MAG: alpha-L-glutamate ligase-like protein [Pseudomonadota bacterium]|nr:MAG: alpha-L-glutamate ligase-like protein [Pseudomonadota bacterium]